MGHIEERMGCKERLLSEMQRLLGI